MKQVKFRRALHIFVVFAAVLFLSVPSQVFAQEWPMPGANPQRTSSVTTGINPIGFQPLWAQPLAAYIPNHAQIVGAGTGSDAKLFVSTSAGLYALDPNTGNQLWLYATEMPLGHAPSVVSGVAYVAGLDRMVHAVYTSNGTAKWKFSGAGAGFVTNPLVVNGKVFVGSRDGFMYALNAENGMLLWKYQTGGPINFSAAYNATNNGIYFASNDSFGYALNADSGALLWKSPKLVGDGFTGFWPVVASGYVYFPGSENYVRYAGSATSPSIATKTSGAWGTDNANCDLPGNATTLAAGQEFNAEEFRTFLTANPTLESFFTFTTTSTPQKIPNPFLWWNTHSGNRYPPAIGNDGRAYVQMSFLKDSPGTINNKKCDNASNNGYVLGWLPGTGNVKAISATHFDVSDEPGAFAIGGDWLYYTHHSDKYGRYQNLVNYAEGDLWGTTFADGTMNGGYAIQGYNTNWINRRYGNTVLAGDRSGTHGHQNAVIPFNGKLYVHRSNSVIAFGSGAAAAQAKAVLATPTSQPTGMPVPSSSDLATLLDTQVQKIISSPFLRPAYAKTTVHYNGDARWLLGDWWLEYWHNPADTVYTLIMALPHLAPSRAAEVRTYLQSYYAKFPLTTITHVGWQSDLAQREAFDLPPDTINGFRTGLTKNPGNTTSANWPHWTFHPFNFYAGWLYAKEFGGANEMLAAFCPKINNPPADSVLQAMPHVHNTFIAGYQGIVNLQAMAPGVCSYNAQAQLDTLKTKKRDFLLAAQTNPAAPLHPYILNGSEAGGFLYLVPELGEYLNTTAKAAVQSIITTLTADQTPYWFVPRIDEPVRYNSTQRHIEGVLSHFHQESSPFLAKALIIKETQAQLAKYIDAPAVERGDLYYIQNLTYALNASGGVPPSITPIPTSTSIPTTPPPVPNTPAGDIHPAPAGDEKVDIFDYNLLVTNFGATNDCFNVGRVDSDCDVDIFDYNLLVGNFGVGGPSPSPSASAVASSTPIATPTSSPQATTTPTPAPQGLQVGTGQAVSAGPTLPDSTTLAAMIAQAVSETRTSYGAGTPKLVIIATNAGNPTATLTAVKNEFGAAVPVAGAGTGSEKYVPLTGESFTGPSNRGISIVAIGGSAIERVSIVGEHDHYPTAVHQGAQEIAETIGQSIQNELSYYSQKSNLLLIYGPNHGQTIAPEMLDGIQDGFEAKGLARNPNFVRFFAAGSADAPAGSSFFDGNFQQGDFSAVLLTGSFKLAVHGTSGGDDGRYFDGCPDVVATEKMNALKTELGGNPELLFYTPGHPDQEPGASCTAQSEWTPQQRYDALRTATLNVFGTNQKIFGYTGGSETGHFTTADPAAAGVYRFFVAGLKAQ